ncbi:hypothetical protein [Helicobacter pylori]|uniref:hypothetical protein n=1 Tax=Helicobacter pylori TaxID=210 RepID=UPI0034677CD2|nr:hypothetical protein E5P75_03185 [Helicobacter pylori]
MEKNDRYAIVTNVIEPLEKGGSFNQRDREKFAIDENLEALKSIRNSILVRDRLPSMWSLLHGNWLQEILKNKNNI